MSAVPLISVVICSRDRPASLRQTLASLAAMTVPAGLDWEVLVVDNATTPPLDAGALATTLPLRIVREPRAGLSHARNRGVAAARGRYLCWTDDDVIVGAQWLAGYADAFVRHPAAAVFGGPVVPRLSEPAVGWVATAAAIPALAGFVAARDFGTHEFALQADDPRQPWGANFAVRSDVQRRYAYDPGRGAGSGAVPLGEESEVIARMLQGGASGWWLPAVRVEHVIGAERQTMRYFLSYFRAAGVTAARVRSGDAVARPSSLARWPTTVLQAIHTLAGPFARAVTAAPRGGLGLRLLARHAFIGGLLGADGGEHGGHDAQPDVA